MTQLHLVNYTPANAPWLQMWLHYDHARTNSDFAAIKSLGANAVRIVVDPSGVGWPIVTKTGASHIRDMVNTARENGLEVQLTLFDWSDPFDDVRQSLRWMKSVVQPFADSPEVALVEVKNEIEATNPTVLSWSRAMLEALPAMLPGVPRTLSVGGSEDRLTMQRVSATSCVRGRGVRSGC